MKEAKKPILTKNHYGLFYIDDRCVSKEEYLIELIERLMERLDKYENKYPILFTHEPVHDLPKGWFNIHGHMHKHKHREFDFQTERHFEVGVDLNNFTPILLHKLLTRLEGVKKE